MAALWDRLQQEVTATVDEFREKGLSGTFQDVVLDTRDMAKDAGDKLWDTVKELAAQPQEQISGNGPVLRADGPLVIGEVYPLEFPDGKIVDAVTMEVDNVSDPPRARVRHTEDEEPILVGVLPPGAPHPRNLLEDEGQEEDDSEQSAADMIRATATRSLSRVKEEWDMTVEDFREKGAVGVLKDALDDVKDLGGEVVEGARSMAAPFSQVSNDARSPAEDGDQAVGVGDVISSSAQAVQGGVDKIRETIRDSGAVEIAQDGVSKLRDSIRETGAVEKAHELAQGVASAVRDTGAVGKAAELAGAVGSAMESAVEEVVRRASFSSQENDAAEAAAASEESPPVGGILTETELAPVFAGGAKPAPEPKPGQEEELID